MRFPFFKIHRKKSIKRFGFDITETLIVLSITIILSAGYVSSSVSNTESSLILTTDNAKQRIQTLLTNSFIGRNFGIDDASRIYLNILNGTNTSPEIKVFDELGNSRLLDGINISTGDKISICARKKTNGGICEPVTNGIIEISLVEPFGKISFYENAETADNTDITQFDILINRASLTRGFSIDRNNLFKTIKE